MKCSTVQVHLRLPKRLHNRLLLKLFRHTTLNSAVIAMLDLAFDYEDACARGSAHAAWWATLTDEEKFAHGRKIAAEAAAQLRALTE